MQSDAPETEACVDLLDSQHGYVLQTWVLDRDRQVVLGRGGSAGVSIPNPFVSRSHAALWFESGVWRIRCLSAGGVFIENKRVDTWDLSCGDELRLSRTGPVLRFRLTGEAAMSSGGATMQLDEGSMPLLILDEAERDREVAAIEQSGYFSELRKLATHLRDAQPSRKVSAADGSPR